VCIVGVKSTMAPYGPHRIPHDYKHQSQGDFENRLEYEKAKPYPYRDYSTRKESIFSDNESTVFGSSKGSSYGGEKPIKSDYYPYPVPQPEKPKKRRRLWPWLIPIVFVLVAIPIATVILVKR
jgi:hypothetical protein